MGRKPQEKSRESNLNTSEDLKKAAFLLRKLTDKDIKKLESVKEVLSPILEKYDAISDLFTSLESKEIKVPISIFVSELTILESVVKYLKDKKEYSLSNIASLLKRDQRNIWHAYDNAKKKYPTHLKTKTSEIFIPVSIFENRNLSAFESLVSYLKADLNLRFSEIASLLEKDARTIWTVWSRARKKNAR
ncbi:MAG: hypothetical protein AABW46_04625 [Nanoarchaeota archaeon]